MKKVFLLLPFCILHLFLSAQNFPSSFTDGKYVTVNGAKLWVVLAGKGEPVVIIPGGPGGNHFSYRRFDTLAKNFTVVYFDALEEENLIPQKM